MPVLTRRFLATLALAAAFAAPALFAPRPAAAQVEEQALVDRATLSTNEIFGTGDGGDARKLLARARAVLVLPRVFRAGLIIGGEGGGGVLLARDGVGNWSYPAFYGMGSGSVGFQIGIQDAQMVLIIMNDRALRAVMDSQFKFGADASVAVATMGAGIEGATTANLNADIVAFSRTRGLFAGISLEGTILSRRGESNRAYYGRDLTPEQIVIGMEVQNSGADPLRAALSRWAQPAQ